MMKKYKYLLILFLINCSLFIAHCYAQDLHFTQFYNSPINLNPANTGNFNGTYRLSLINRNQWRAVSVPFKTFSASTDIKLINRPLLKDILAIGLMFNTDKAGDTEFGTNQFNFSVSYIKAIDDAASQFISIGLSAGAGQRSMNYSNITLDNQYNGYMYDPTKPNYITDKKENMFYPDISAGINWLYYIKQRNNLSIGFAFFHLNNPDLSMVEDGSSPLSPKASINISSNIQLLNWLDINPMLYYTSQSSYTKFIPGALFRVIPNSSAENFTSFNIGFFSRINDAFNMTAGFDYKNVTLGLGYDINYSKLREASNSRGAFEISLIYRIFKNNPSETKKPKCIIL